MQLWVLEPTLPLLFSSQYSPSLPRISLSLSLSLCAIHLFLCSTMEESTFSLLPLMLFLLLIQLTAGNGEEETVLRLHRFQWRSPVITSCSSQKSRKENGATILEMKHRGYCSTEDWIERLQRQLNSDDIRVKSIQSRMKNTAAPGQTQGLLQTQIPLTSGINLQTLNYIVTAELGGLNMTLIVDTGSDLTWVQCQPCNSCYNQMDPLFNPSKSPSFHPIFCNSPACRSLQLAGNSVACGNNPSSSCSYLVSYGDGSFTSGDLAGETFHLGASPVDNFVFGCGRNNKGLFGGASGLMGLGRGDLSLISQTSSLFGGVFSYCLPSADHAESSGSLIFGNDSSVYKNSTPFSFTKVVENPQLSTFYLLNLTGISIGGVALQAPGFNNGGILIDSGTVITRLAPPVYRALKAEFLKQFSGFPPAPEYSILDTCFNLSAYQEVSIPTIRMQFEGNAELNVDVTGIFYFVKADASQVCLAVAGLDYDDDIPIIGNYQQRNTRVVYDNNGSKVGFARETCSFT
ncbi:LOW QUALITY PROTEIN: aspartyl protease family protein At5g10770 [Diospyros lotus]|uniref:LOW QUALITY PROTEIN: aspartyl protease family protein At5g10770 n=1 Tax=Diospyros lotus TaxID=55363 RepID=UPI0022515AFB|nr:LOW QUALITY PROTEIN: aspartyl protease family protein At5g10770 [Diospyros lotus]